MSAACCLARCALTDAAHALTDAAPHCCARRICVPDAEAKEISSTYTATTPTPDSTQGLAGMLDSIVSGPFPVPFPPRRPLSAVPSVAVPLAPLWRVRAGLLLTAQCMLHAMRCRVLCGARLSPRAR